MTRLARPALAVAGLVLSIAAGAAGTLHVVDQSGKVFTKTELTVSAGDQLKVVNKDTVTHSLFARTPDYDIRETQTPGAESTFTFDKPGTVELRCAIHPQMLLKVTVTP